MKAFLFLLCASLTSCAIEKPVYESLEKEGKYELRKYPAIQVVSAPMEGMEKRDESFRKLFRYISGDNADKQKIAMTSPVFMETGNKEEEKADAGRMSFMIPSKVAEKGAPAPDGEGIAVTEIGGGTYAVLRFGGWNKEASRDKASGSLTEIVAGKGLKPIGELFFAFYDPPWTPEFLRRNEVWQKVDR